MTEPHKAPPGPHAPAASAASAAGAAPAKAPRSAPQFAAQRRSRPARPARSAERQTGVALEACYGLLLWLVPVLEKFPRSQKFLLGDRLQQQALAVLDALIAATYVPAQRRAQLQAANLALEHLRFGFRLAHDLRLVDMARYQYAAERVDEVGRLVGGWLRSAQPGQGEPVEGADVTEGPTRAAPPQ